MVYSRLVNGYGPYLYRSVRDGNRVHSIYMGKGSVGGSSVSQEEAPQGDKNISSPSPIRRQGESEMDKVTRKGNKWLYQGKAYTAPALLAKLDEKTKMVNGKLVRADVPPELVEAAWRERESYAPE